LQLFHHSAVLGGSWISPSKQLVAILGFDIDAKPIQIVEKSIKDVKAKSYSCEEFASGLENSESFEQLKNPKVEFHYKNIIPIPHLLTKTFMDLSDTDTFTVAKAFFEQMYHYDSQPNEDQFEPELNKENGEDDKSIPHGMNDDFLNPNGLISKPKLPEFLQEIIQVIQCQRKNTSCSILSSIQH
jgi:hypothetical protein